MSTGQSPSVEILAEMLAAGDAARLQEFLHSLPPGESARLLTRLGCDEQVQLLALLPAEAAAAVLKELSESQAADLLELLEPGAAAAALAWFPSNEQADLLAKLDPAHAEAIVALLPAEAANRVRKLRPYPADTAGGLMVAEYLAYRDDVSVTDVIEDLREHANRYSRYQVQYVFITDAADRLIGVLRLRDLLLLERNELVRRAMTADPVRLKADEPLESLLRLFDRHEFFGIPVVDESDRLLGVVLRAEVEEAISERAERLLLLASGVLGGEEFRSMSWRSRILRRAPWLGVSLVLSLSAASVIGWYQETLSSAIALAVFLPVISGMGGNSGNQALSVSIRELALGLVQSNEFRWVILKEASVGLMNGICLGLTVAAISFVWQRDIRLSAVVGVAIGLNTLVAACLGGIVPLLLKRWQLDPALASGPILAAVNDMCGFLFALVLADALMG